MTARVFIDGEAGTTGLQIRERLAGRRDISPIRLDDSERKDREARRRALNAADAVILCLPDDAAREAVALVENDRVRVIDASTAHRVAPGWTYGFPEMADGQEDAIRSAARIANPGCYPTGFVALVRPLVEAGLLPPDFPLTVNAVSGYSGGGKALIARFEGADGGAAPAFYAYGLALAHKHLPEMQVHALLDRPPVFAPAVGRYRQGMLVQVPLQLWALPGRPSPADIHAALAARYAGRGGFVTVAPFSPGAAAPELDPEALNGTNGMRLAVFGRAETGQCLLAATLDNLGKGASGAAVQCLNLALGLDPAAGLGARLAA